MKRNQQHTPGKPNFLASLRRHVCTKKRLFLLYGVFLLLCVVLAAVTTDFDYDSTLSETYGLATDSTVVLEEGSEMQVDFTLNCDCFEGLNVKFQADDGFGEEELLAQLYDRESGELLAEDTIALKYELVRNSDSGSYIYLTLPVEDAEGREVSLILTLQGSEIYTTPEFVVSDSHNLASTLSVDGETVEEQLVFTSYYTAEVSAVSEVTDAILKAILWIFVGSLLFLWAAVSAFPSEKETGMLVRLSRIFSRCKACFGKLASAFLRVFRKRKTLAAYLFVLLLLIGTLLYVYEYHIERVMDQREETAILEESASGETFCLDEDVQSVEQHFLVRKNRNVTAVMIKLTSASIGENAKLYATVMDDTTGDVLASDELLLSEKLTVGETFVWKLTLDETLVTSRKHDLSVTLRAEEFDGTAVEIPYSYVWEDTEAADEALTEESQAEDAQTEQTEETADDQLYINGEPDNSTLAVTLEYGNTFFLLPMYLIFCAGVLLIVSLLYFLIFVRRISLTRLCPVLILSLGLMMGCVITMYGVPDEPSHIDTAYQLSNELMGIPDSEKDGYIYKRADDADMTAENKEDISVASYERLYRQLFTRVQDDTLVECRALSALNNAGRIYYLPQALGITLGRLLGLGTMPMLMLGRLFALIAYAILTTLAVKKLPVGKVSLMLIAVLPISLQQAASFSYDSVINGVAFLFVSYSIFLCTENVSVRFCDIAVTVVTGCLMATVKGSVYIPLCLLPLGIFLVKSGCGRKQKALIGAVTVVCLYAFLRGNLSSIISRLSRTAAEAVGGSDSTQIYTFGYFIQYPRRLVGMLANTIYKQGDAYLRNLLGGYLGWLQITIPWFVIIGFLFLLLLSCIAHPGERRISGRKRAFWAILAAGSLFLVEISMLFSWTSTDSYYIEGVQGRYFIPFLLLVLLVLRNSFFQTKKILDRRLLFMSGFLNAIVWIQIIQKVIYISENG
ncbi:MAG: DUF2142 domain-containing protein [Lachnospiraceae bacterium]|nr:DUF2142 domain-containing protein [Lachnospiraceae bacterium]